jgi:translocation and assembly module TamB
MSTPAVSRHVESARTFGAADRHPNRVSPIRVLRWLGAFVGGTVLFALSAGVGLITQLDTPSARKIVAAEVNGVLGPLFQGRVHIDRLGALGVLGLAGTDVTVDDPAGLPVLVARGVRVTVATLAAARSALLDTKDPLTIDLKHVGVDELDVRLDTNSRGELDLLDAFASKTPSTAADPNARGLCLVIGDLAVRHARAHGQMAGAPPLDISMDDFDGTLTYAPDVLEAEVSRATIAARRLAMGADVAGSLQGHVREPSDPKARMDAWVDWQGLVAGMPHGIHASLTQNKVDATVDAPNIDPEGIRALWAASPIDRSGTIHAEAHGILPDVDATLIATLGNARLTAKAGASIGDEKRARVSFEAADIDAHELAASAPKSRLGLDGFARGAAKPDGTFDMDLGIHLRGGSLGAYEAPPVSITATARRTNPNTLAAHADVVVDEPAAPTRLALAASAKGPSSVLDFNLTSDVPDLGRVPQLKHTLRGAVHVRASGGLDLGRSTVDGVVHARAANIVEGSTRADAAVLDAGLRGAAADPRIDIALHAQGVAIAGRHLDHADVTATGHASAPHVTASVRGQDVPDVDASADLSLRSGVSVRTPRIAVARSGERAIVTAQDVRIDGSDMRVQGARIEGIGQPVTATWSTSSQRVRVEAATEGIDLARVGRLVHVEKTLRNGIMAFDADVTARTDAATGRASFTLSRAAIASVNDAAAHLELELEGRRLTGKAHAQAARVGSVDIDARNVAFAGAGPLIRASWKEASGWFGIEGHVDLAEAAALVPSEDLPLEARGEVTFKAHGARDPGRAFTPDVGISMTTTNLQLAPRTSKEREIDGVLVLPAPGWHLQGVDFKADATLDGQTGVLELSTQARDKTGELADLQVRSAHFPYEDAWVRTGRLSTDLHDTPFDLRLVVPERGLGTWPDWFKQDIVDGRLQANVTFHGTILTPTLDLAATLKGSRVSSRAAPIDFDVRAHYDGHEAIAALKGRSGGHDTLDVETKWQAPIAAFIEGAAALPWSASAKAHFSEFPLQTIAFLDDKGVSGQLDGDFTLDKLHEDARAWATLAIDRLKVATIPYKSGRIQLAAGGHQLDALIHVDQTDGFADANAHGAIDWGAKVAPALDPSKPLDVTLSSKNFRIAALLPFVESTLAALDGRLDGDARVALDPKTRGATLSGSLALSGGKLEAVAGGGEFHDISANVRFSPDGTITLDKLRASGVTGAFQATASARMAGTNLQSAKGTIVIPSRSAIPLSVDGTEIGTIDGRFEIGESAVDGQNSAMSVRVNVPNLRVVLPDSSTTHALSLGPMDGAVRIGAHQGHPATFVVLPIDPIKRSDGPKQGPSSSLTIATDLSDVRVVRGTDIQIELDGRLNVKTGAATDVQGQIHLKKGGVISVQGRNFSVENGTVTMVSDPSNPEVVVKAGWTAPDGTVVYANFVGPLKTGKVTLTSEPTLPQQEIVELLMFGTATGQQVQSPSADPTTSAIATAGGEAAQPLNHMLNQLGLGAVSANVDTSQAETPKPEVEVQIARDISVQIAVVLGQPPPGVNPDHTLLTLGWRFLSKWSLASTLGDAGTTIFDLLWQTRY